MFNRQKTRREELFNFDIKKNAFFEDACEKVELSLSHKSKVR